MERELTLFAFDEASCQRIAARHTTPLFAYHAAVAEQSCVELLAVLPPRVKLVYAVKANPHRELISLFARLGAGFDCASIGELERVRQLAEDPPIFFAGPGKSREAIALALALGARFQVESFEELELLEELGSGELAVNLRLHPRAGVIESSPIIGGCGPSAFGFDEEQLDDVCRRFRAADGVRVTGLHVFAASNERRVDKLLETYEAVLLLGCRLQKELGQQLTEIDLGGGLGLPYSPAETPLALPVLATGLRALLARHTWFSGDLILEPGRFLAGPCGVYLSRVVRVKESRGSRFVVLEGGINHLLRPLLTGQPFPVRACGVTGPERPAVLAGPLCTSLDRLGEVMLPEVVAGDLLAFGQCGAYGRTEAMTRFLDHPPPAELWLRTAARRELIGSRSEDNSADDGLVGWGEAQAF